MRLAPAVALGLLLTALPPALAQGAAYAGTVGASDPDRNLALQTFPSPAGFVDANGNSRFDAAQPAEVLYIDADNTGTVSFGDLRLNPFLSYGAGTAVDYTNRDFGRIMHRPAGWFARSAAGDWWFDADANRGVSWGDLRVTGAGAGTAATTSGEGLTAVQETVTQALRVGYNDGNSNQQRDHDEALYLDVNTDRQVNPGELRMRPVGLGLDDEVHRPELQTAQTQTQSDLTALRARDDLLGQEQRQGDTALQARLAEQGRLIEALQDRAGSLNTMILLVALVAIAGIAGAVHYARKLHASGPRP